MSAAYNTRPCQPLSRIAAYDVWTCIYLVTIATLATVFATRVPQWWWYPLTHGLVIVGLGILLLYLPSAPPGWLLFVRYWYPVVLIPPIFRELAHLVHPINSVDIDPQLIAIDFAFFGVHPTVWLERVTFPWLTEYLQLAYVTYYFLPFHHRRSRRAWDSPPGLAGDFLVPAYPGYPRGRTARCLSKWPYCCGPHYPGHGNILSAPYYPTLTHYRAQFAHLHCLFTLSLCY